MGIFYIKFTLGALSRMHICMQIYILDVIKEMSMCNKMGGWGSQIFSCCIASNPGSHKEKQHAHFLSPSPRWCQQKKKWRNVVQWIISSYYYGGAKSHPVPNELGEIFHTDTNNLMCKLCSSHPDCPTASHEYQGAKSLFWASRVHH